MMLDMRLVALLPMKAHSERVANKNMRLFAGRPLYHKVAEILQKCLMIDRIIVNTDSELIAQDALKHFSKIQINMRPAFLCGDMVPMNDILAYDIASVEAEHFLQTHSTNPLLTLKTIFNAIEAYFSALDRFDSLFSVTRFQTRFYRSDGNPVNHDPGELMRTQDLPPFYEENSNIYLFSRKSFADAGNKRIGLKPQMFEMGKLEAVDIDDQQDWDLAEALIGMYLRESERVK